MSNHSWTEILAFNKAAVLTPVGPLTRVNAEAVLERLNLNLGSGLLFMQTILSTFTDMPCSKTLVNLSSGAAMRGLADWSLCCANKVGLDGAVHALAVEQEALPHPFRLLNRPRFTRHFEALSWQPSGGVY
ncbi:MAG: hypothetical protein CGU28_04920, partial [Candidatus Dactylopiibacterium carminicum]